MVHGRRAVFLGKRPEPCLVERHAALAVALLASGCGGGAATLYPAHPLAQNQVSAGAGVSGNFAFAAGKQTASSGPADPEQTFVDDSVRNALLAPGLAPWVGARVGIGGQNEGGLTYTGRTARLDARHAFVSDEFALSIGAGASAVLMHPGLCRSPGSSTANASCPQQAESSPADAGRFNDPNAQFNATGWGLELPVIVGWRSSASVISVWGGVRAGFERISGAMLLGASAGAAAPTGLPLTADLVGSRVWGGGLLGFAIGIKPIWVAAELDAAYQAMSVSADFPAGTVGPAERGSTLGGVTIAPTGAIIGKFW